MKQNDTSHIRQNIADVLREQGDVLFGYLFGSVATGTARVKSDIDIAVYLRPESKDRFFDIRLSLMEKLTRALSREADVIVLNTASPLLKYVVLQEGVCVFRNDEESRIAFELKATNEYIDYKPVLKQYYNRLRAPV